MTGIVAAELHEGGVRLRESAWPQRPPVVVRPLIAGVCSSDLKEVRRRREVRSDFGHEMVGVVHRSAVAGLPPGLRVILDPHVAVERTTAFGTAMAVSGSPDLLRAALPAVPAAVPDERAVFTEPLACVAHCAKRVTAGSEVTIVGAGTAGVLLSVLLRLDGCRVTLINRGAARLRHLASLRLLDGVRLAATGGPATGGSATGGSATGGSATGGSATGGSTTVVIATTLLDDATFARAWRLLPERGGRLVLFGGIASGWRVPGTGLLLDRVRRDEDEIELAWDGRRALVAGSHGPGGADFAAASAVLGTRLPWTAGHVEELIVGRHDLPGLVGLLNAAARSGADPVGKHVVDLRA